MTMQQREIQKTSAGNSESSASSKRAVASTESGVPTHDQIAARARAIWQSKGCPPDRDQENWREAEAELRKLAKAKA